MNRLIFSMIIMRLLNFIQLLLLMTTKPSSSFMPCFVRNNAAESKAFSILWGTTSSSSSSSSSVPAATATTTTTTTTATLSRIEAAQLIQQQLLPQSDYGARVTMGRNELFKSTTGSNDDDDAVVLSGNDPLLSFSYGEFPLSSLDFVLDQALEILAAASNDNPSRPCPGTDAGTLNMLDLGSGCGRLCLYLALTRGPHWQVHGIEVSNAFHRQALQAQQKAVDLGWLSVVMSNEETDDDDDEDSTHHPREQQKQQMYSSRLVLHHGLVEDFPQVLAQSHVIFCYSTAFTTCSSFRPDIGAMILSPMWTNLLTKHCQSNCIVITTDRALDPDAGWKLLRRIDHVPNPEVMDSTVFIQQKIQYCTERTRE
jgi:hypothetical protein